jgi:hypothetical protein
MTTISSRNSLPSYIERGRWVEMQMLSIINSEFLQSQLIDDGEKPEDSKKHQMTTHVANFATIVFSYAIPTVADIFLPKRESWEPDFKSAPLSEKNFATYLFLYRCSEALGGQEFIRYLTGRIQVWDREVLQTDVYKIVRCVAYEVVEECFKKYFPQIELDQHWFKVGGGISFNGYMHRRSIFMYIVSPDDINPNNENNLRDFFQKTIETVTLPRLHGSF